MAKAPKPDKTQSVRFRPDDLEIIKKLREKNGLDVTSVIRVAIRRLAEAEGLR